MIPKPSSCAGCPLYDGPFGSKEGFSRPDGAFNKGVLMVAEALGENELHAGVPLVGKAGHYLFNALKRVGLDREDFRLFNVVACRPPNNKLAGMPYEVQAVNHCRSNLDSVIATSRREASERGLNLVILTLGKTAFKRVMGFTEKDAVMREDYLCYPFWSPVYECWVIAADHPSYLMRGNHHLISVLQFAALRATEIAEHGLKLDQPQYLLDPEPAVFKSWVVSYLDLLERDQDTILSYDIETPMKQGESEEGVEKEDEDADQIILRVSFCYRPGNAVSVPWRPEFLPFISQLFASPGVKTGWNNQVYDDPRIRAKMPLNGTSVDAMLAWHVLNSALPKGLGFVTPFYVKNILMWKHLSDAEPAFYNAKDADMALRNYLGIQRDLKDNNLWGVFDRHVIQLNKLFAFMSAKGVTLDQEGRAKAEVQLKAMLDEVQTRIEAAVPLEAKNLKVYKKTPKSVEGLIQTSGVRQSKVCPTCGIQDVVASHFKSIGKKRLSTCVTCGVSMKKHGSDHEFMSEAENPCHGAKPIKKEVIDRLWARVEPFALSKTSLERYQEVLKHKPIYDPKEKKITFDEKAMMRLMKRYPNDPLYPEVGQFRKLQKLLTTYIGVTEDGEIRGGLPTDKEGVIHTTFTHNPSTLRSASQNPNLQNLPRPGGKDDPATIIRNLVVARPGNVFLARDFSGIEAVLVGYAASDPGYIRLARHDVHSFYTAYALHELDGRISANDLPLLSWDDEKLFTRLAEIKKEFKEDRNALYKHLVHGANFMQGARGAAEKILNETGKEFPVALVQKVMNIYFELFPAIKKWHTDTLARADQDGYLRNPFGYVHRFYRVYEWEKVGDKWQKEPGPDANKVIAFWPQSSAAGIIKDAMLRMFQNHFETAGQYIRLLVHDEIFMEVPEAQVAEVDAIMKMEMERPIQCMPMMPEWKMGDYLTILTEAKVGNRWGSMK